MVEWISLVLNGLWVLGAAVILAAFSVSYYGALCHGERLRTWLAGLAFQLPLALGLILISLGAALIGPRWWERALWGGLCAMSVCQLWDAWRDWRAKRGRSSPLAP
jgi:hypothetical protein